MCKHPRVDQHQHQYGHVRVCVCLSVLCATEVRGVWGHGMGVEGRGSPRSGQIEMKVFFTCCQ